MTDLSDQIASAKETITKPFPHPPSMEGRQAAPEELLKRLNWGEPALTIVDVRNHDAFNAERIMGAVPLPMDGIVERAESTLEHERNIYIYGDSPEQATEAANQLRQAGFGHVAELQGGLEGWKAIKGPVEGASAWPAPGQPAKTSPIT